MNRNKKLSIRQAQDKKIKSNKLGFTLIELLISTAIVITSATVVIAIISATFRTSSKASTEEQIRQTGNSAISQASSMIQYADSFKGAYDVNFPPDPPDLASCNADTSLADTSVSAVKISVDGQERIIACVGGDGLTLDGKSMFNRGKYSMSGCSLTCAQTSSSESPVIGIKFSLDLIGINLVESSSSLDFSKTVKMVNLNQ